MKSPQIDYVNKCYINRNIRPLIISHTQRDVSYEGKYHLVIQLVMTE
jgi:hypothetical protein